MNDSYVGVRLEQSLRASCEAVIDLNRENAPRGADDLTSQRGAIPRARAKFDEMVARRESQFAIRKQIRVRRADGRETLFVQEQRCIGGTVAHVIRSYESFARDLEQSGEQWWFERPSAPIGLVDEFDPREPCCALELFVRGDQTLELVRRRTLRSCGVPLSDRGEPFAGFAHLCRKYRVVHGFQAAHLSREVKSPLRWSDGETAGARPWLAMCTGVTRRHRSSAGCGQRRSACYLLACCGFAGHEWTSSMHAANSEFSVLATRLVADGVAPAMAIAASTRAGQHWSRAATYAGRLSAAIDDRATSEDTFFDLASVTKPITALTVARLVRAGELEYGEPLRACLPELGGTPAGSATIELLLAHRSGLEAHRPLFAPLTRGESVDPRAAIAEAACALRKDCSGGPPPHGFAPVYSDLGYLLLGEAIARRTNQPLAQVVRERVLVPLHLARDLGTAEQLRQQHANFEHATAATELILWRGGIVRGAVHDDNAWAIAGLGMCGHAGLFGRAWPVLRIGEVLLEVQAGDLPEFLTASELDVLIAPRPGGSLRAGFDGKSEQGSSTGQRWGARTVGHLGFTGTSLWVDPDAGLVGVLLTNRVHPTRDSPRIREARPIVYDAIAQWGADERLRCADASLAGAVRK